MDFSRKLKALRQEKDFTQIELGLKTGIPQSLISAWELGKNQPLAETLVKLADFFNCSIDYLVGRETEDGRIIVSNDTEIPSLSSLEQEFLTNFKSLSRNAQYQVMGFMEALQTQETRFAKLSQNKNKN